MNIEISVICLTYNSDLKKTLTTLNSVVNQKDCSFELIIADDGSKDNQFDEIMRFLNTCNFSNYRLQANETNKGIICNYLSAIELAQGRYIKYISPGDYLYDEFTLSKCVYFMKEYNAEIAFGKALYYRVINGKLDILKKQDPVFTELYDTNNDNYDYDLVLKYLVLYQDYILGASVIVDRLVFEGYLREIIGKVKYIEDNTIMPLVTLDKKRIYYFNEYILWYECDSGISTNQNRGFKEKISVDFLKCYEYLTDKCPNNFVIKLAYWKQKSLVDKSKLRVSTIKRIMDIFYGRKKYENNRKNKQIKFVIGNFDIYNWIKWQNM